jgi:outer membrane protein
MLTEALVPEYRGLFRRWHFASCQIEERHPLKRGTNIVSGILFMIMSFAASSALAQNKLGFISLDRILRDAAPAQRAQKRIEAEFSKRDQELLRISEQLKKMQDGLEKNAVTMSETERTRRQREFTDLNRDFERKQREFREDLSTRRNEELSAVVERANRAIRQIAEAEKFDVIFQNDQVVWASPRIDLTDRVIKSLEDSSAAK